MGSSVRPEDTVASPGPESVACDCVHLNSLGVPMATAAPAFPTSFVPTFGATLDSKVDHGN
jgi:hypothetical protein